MPNLYVDGMTMRDFFASQIIAGLSVPENDKSELQEWDFDTIARIAYRGADAMLKAREKTK